MPDPYTQSPLFPPPFPSAGVELIAEFIITSMNVPSHPVVLKDAPEGSMVVYYLCCPLTGEMLDDNFMDEVRKVDGVHSATPWAHAGDQVKGYDTQVHSEPKAPLEYAACAFIAKCVR